LPNISSYNNTINCNKIENQINNTKGNILISQDNSYGDDFHPRIAKNDENVLIVTYEKYTTSNHSIIPICYSDDLGRSWKTRFNISSKNSNNLISPDIIYCPNTDEFFWISTDVPFNISMVHMSRFPSNIFQVNDLDIVLDKEYYDFFTKFYSVVVGYVEDNFLKLGIFDAKEDPYTPAVDRCPNLAYFNPNWEPPGEKSSSNFYDGQRNLKTAPAYQPGIASGDDFFYIVLQYTDELSGSSKIVFKAFSIDLYMESGGFYDNYADIEFTPWQFYLEYDAEDPDIEAGGNNVCVVYKKNDSIVCSYSFDDGISWNKSIVANRGSFPSVWMDNITIFCAYVNNGNIYKTVSYDGGMTWNIPKRLNDIDGTVIEDYNTLDIIDKGVVWTDNRNGLSDIYFANKSDIGINKFITSFASISVSVINNGTAPEFNINWSITLDGIIFLGEKTEGNMPILIGGDDTIISSDLILGFGPTKVSIKVGDYTYDFNVFLLGPFFLGGFDD